MSTEAFGPYWNEDNTSHEAAKQWNEHRKTQPNAAARQFLYALPEVDNKLNARMVMHKHRSDFALLDCDLPPKSKDKAPVVPNVFNDGSLKNASCQWWSAGGIGVWWPERKLTQDPLNTNERHLVARISNKGVILELGKSESEKARHAAK